MVHDLPRLMDVEAFVSYSYGPGKSLMPKMSYGRLDRNAAVLALFDYTDREKTSCTTS